MTVRTKSEKVYISSCGVFPGGVNSPVRSFQEIGLSPLVVKSGKADLIWDVDGNPYIDFCMSWGAMILGHAYPPVVDSVVEQMRHGSSFGIMTEMERDLAEKIISHYPSMERIRFVSSGTEASMSAIRLARGYTGKSVIVKFNGHYHGHVDSLLIQAGSGVSLLSEASSAGIPADMIKHTISLPFNEVEIVRAFLQGRDDIAAVLLEPIAANMGVVPARPEFLQMLREETKKLGALLIMDEVVTGFRVGLTGAQGLYGIIPDLTCLGKIIGGGLPAAAFGGKKEIMESLAPLGSVYQAGTLSGNPLAMKAGLATLSEVEKPGFYAALEQKTNLLLRPIEDVIRERNIPVCLQRVGSMFTLFFGVRKVTKKEDLGSLDAALFKKFFRYLFQEGIYIAPSQYEASYVSIVHTADHLVKTRDRILRFLSEL